jgi:hypothetical protein
MSFKYDKDNLFKEFEVAKTKDIKLSKKKTQDERENDRFDNRIQFFKDHIALKATNPEYYEDVDVKFDRLLIAYQSPDPRDHFYKSVFDKSYAQIMAESQQDRTERESLRN